MKRLLAGCAVVAATLLGAGEAAAADFTVSPAVVKTGNLVTFEASPGDPADSWDLDGDGVAGDKTGSPVQWAYAAPGPVAVTLYPPAPDVPVTKVIQVQGPPADFVSFPAAPVVGEEVKFIYSQREDVDSIEWDLNSDEVYGDVKGPIATMAFPAPGTYAVRLRVTNLDEPPARSTSTQLITVTPPPPPARAGGTAPARLMTPFPVVRITGKVGRRGARIKRLTVRAPYGATVSVRCKGRGCPFTRSNRTLALAGRVKSPAKTIRIKKLERRLLRGGSTIKVLVSRPGEIGKYTRFKIRRGKPPLRRDLCLGPGSAGPAECPS